MKESIITELSQKAARQIIPLDVTWEITKNCNHTCKPCYVVKQKNKELSLREGNTLIDSLANLGMLYLTFTGGEPFLRKNELKKWAFKAQRLGAAVTIFTNGTLIQKKDILWLKELIPLSVHISIFSSNPKMHDDITGIKGSFNKAIESIKRLSGAGVRVIMKTLLMKENFEQMQKVISLAKSLNVSWGIDPVVTTLETGGRSVLRYRLTKEKIEKVFADTSDMFISKFKPGTKEEFICTAGISMASISAYGDVFPCLMYPEQAGSLKKESFSDIWHESKLLKKIRSLTVNDIKGCADCKDVAYCSWCPGFAKLEDNNPFGKSSMSCLLAGITKKLV